MAGSNNQRGCRRRGRRAPWACRRRTSRIHGPALRRRLERARKRCGVVLVGRVDLGCDDHALYPSPWLATHFAVLPTANPTPNRLRQRAVTPTRRENPPKPEGPEKSAPMPAPTPVPKRESFGLGPLRSPEEEPGGDQEAGVAQRTPFAALVEIEVPHRHGAVSAEVRLNLDLATRGSPQRSRPSVSSTIAPPHPLARVSRSVHGRNLC